MKDNPLNKSPSRSLAGSHVGLIVLAVLSSVLVAGTTEAQELQVVSTLPAPNALAVEPNITIEVVFDRPVDPATVEGKTFIYNRLHGYLSHSIVVEGDTIRLELVEPLPTGERIDVVLTSEIRAMDASLFTPHQWQFHTLGSDQLSFIDHWSSAVAHFSIEDFSLGDLDGDSDVDLVLAEGSLNTWFQSGFGQFPPTVYGSFLGATVNRLGDLDGDGDLDLVCDCSFQDTNSLLLNEGEGNFIEGVPLVLHKPRLFDFNGDGQLDIYDLGTSASLYLNLGQGTFSSNVLPDDPNLNGQDLDVGDLDGDGDLDLYIVGDGPNSVWLGDGEGGFLPTGQQLGEDDSTSVELGDLDGDGDLDAFVSNRWGEPNRVWFNDGVGGFTGSEPIFVPERWASYPTPTEWVVPETRVVDVDGDGDLDALEGGYALWLNDGHGLFEEVLVDQRFSRRWFFSDLADIDGDGDLDGLLNNESSVIIILNRLLPRARLDSFQIEEDTPLLIEPSVLFENDTSPEQLALVLDRLWLPQGQPGDLVALEDGTYLYTPPEDFYGEVELNYRSSEEGGLQLNTALVRIDILPVADPPVIEAHDDLWSVNEGMTFANTRSFLVVTDPDEGPDDLVYSLVSPPEHGVLKRDGVEMGSLDTFTQSDVEDRLLAYTHDGSENHTDGFVLDLNTREGDTIEGISTTILVRPLNDRPTIESPGPVTLAEGESVTVPIAVFDPEDNITTVTVTGLPQGLSVEGPPWRISGAPAVGTSAQSPYQLTLRAEDEFGPGNRVQVLWTVVVPPLPPELELGGPYEVDEGDEVALSAQASDPNGDDLVLTWDLDGDGDCDDAQGLTATVRASDGPASLIITACVTDGVFESRGQTRIEVANVRPIILSQPSTEALTGSPYTYNVEVTEPGDDELSFTLLRSHETIQTESSSVVWAPTYELLRPHPFQVQLEVCDDDGSCDRQEWAINLSFPDEDADGVPDDCETRFEGLDPDDPDDGDQDLDGDGISNRDECLGGTVPDEFNGPTAPALRSPENPGRSDVLTPTLVVDNATDPDNDPLLYEFELFDSERLVDPLHSITDLQVEGETVSWQLGEPLLDNTRYWWRARAHDPLVAGPFSEVGVFVVDQFNSPPSRPTPISPQGATDTLTPTFVVDSSFDPEGDDITYTFVIFSDVGLTQEVANVSSDQTSVLLPVELEEDRSYWWRAFGTDSEGLQGSTSDALAFKVNTDNALPGPPRFVSPDGSRTLTSLPVELIVEAATDDDGDRLSHRLQVASDANFSNITLDVDLDEENFVDGLAQLEVGELEDDATFYLRARARDFSGVGPYAETTFHLNHDNAPPTPPTLVSPVGGEVVDPEGFELVVRSSSDPDGVVESIVVEIFEDPSSPEPVWRNVKATRGAREISFLVTNLASNEERFFWRARAVDELGLEGRSSEFETLVFKGVIEEVSSDGRGCVCSHLNSNPLTGSGSLLLLTMLLGGGLRTVRVFQSVKQKEE